MVDWICIIYYIETTTCFGTINGHLQVDNEKLNKQLHSICVCCVLWGGKRRGCYEISHALFTVGGGLWYFLF